MRCDESHRPLSARPSTFFLWGCVALLVLAATIALPSVRERAYAQDEDIDAGADSEEPAGSAELPEFQPVVPQLGDETIHSWALTPAGNNNESGATSRSDLSYTGDPGTVIEDAVTLFNLGNLPLTFRVYATDAINSASGEFSLLDGADTPTDIGSWVTVEQELVTVAPGQAATIPITIAIPSDAAPGDHIGGVLASNESISTSEDGSTVLVDRRTGTRLYFRVGGPIRPELAVEDLSIDYSGSANPLDGTATVSYTIQNRGNVRLDGVAIASVAGPFGIGRQSAASTEFVDLLPGQGFEVSTEITDVAALMLATARVELAPDEAGEGAGIGDIVRESTTLALPLVIVLFGLLALFAWFARRAQRRHQGLRELSTTQPRRLPEPAGQEVESEQLVS